MSPRTSVGRCPDPGSMAQRPHCSRSRPLSAFAQEWTPRPRGAWFPGGVIITSVAGLLLPDGVIIGSRADPPPPPQDDSPTDTTKTLRIRHAVNVKLLRRLISSPSFGLTHTRFRRPAEYAGRRQTGVAHPPTWSRCALFRICSPESGTPPIAVWPNQPARQGSR